MLVLSRKSGESVCIGRDIEVKVLDICGGRVRLGFSAPLSVDIQRREITGTHAGRFEERGATATPSASSAARHEAVSVHKRIRQSTVPDA